MIDDYIDYGRFAPKGEEVEKEIVDIVHVIEVEGTKIKFPLGRTWEKNHWEM